MTAVWTKIETEHWVSSKELGKYVVHLRSGATSSSNIAHTTRVVGRSRVRIAEDLIPELPVKL